MIRDLLLMHHGHLNDDDNILKDNQLPNNLTIISETENIYSP